MRKKITKKHPFLPKRSIIVLGLLLVALIAIWSFRSLLANRRSVITTSGPTSTQQKEEASTAADQKKQYIEGMPKTSNVPSKEGSGSSSAGSSSTGERQISLSAQVLKNGTVTIHTNLSGISDGSCQLMVTNGSAKTSQSAQVIYAPEGSTCAGFSVPINSIGKGTWKITLTVSPLSGSPVSKTLIQDVE